MLFLFHQTWHAGYSRTFVNIMLSTITSYCAGGSTDTNGLSAEGITGRVLLILTEVISMLVLFIMFAKAAYSLRG